MRTDREILDEIEEVYEDVKDDHESELSPKAIDWLISKAREAVDNQKTKK